MIKYSRGTCIPWNHTVSQEGVGGALLQPSDGKLQPLAYTSCKMRSNEESWTQIEKECLGNVAACDTWDLWLYGQAVTVDTDHQPLETIFKKPLRSAPRRLQEMMLHLQRYRVNICHKKGSSLYDLLTDTISRATQDTTNDSKQINFEVFLLNMDEDESAENSGITSSTMSEVKSHTSNDPVLNSLVAPCWPELREQIYPSVAQYWTFP